LTYIGALKSVYRRVGVIFMCHMDDHGFKEPKLRWVNTNAETLDDASSLKRLDAIPARRGGKSDTTPKLLNGCA